MFYQTALTRLVAGDQKPRVWERVMMDSRKFATSIIAGASMLLMAGVAQAATATNGDIAVSLVTPAPQPGEVSINLNGDNSGTTNVGTGVPNTVGGIPLITFTADVNVTFASGSATILPALTGGKIGSLTVSVPTGFFFTDFQFSEQGADSIFIQAFNGVTPVGDYTNTDIFNGPTGNQAFLTIAASPGVLFTSIVISGALGAKFDELKQFFISGLVNCGPTGSGCAPVPPNAVPLPAALPLFAAGAGFLGFVGWRRKKRMA